jgi:hypothetical protein
MEILTCYEVIGRRVVTLPRDMPREDTVYLIPEEQDTYILIFATDAGERALRELRRQRLSDPNISPTEPEPDPVHRVHLRLVRD